MVYGDTLLLNDPILVQIIVTDVNTLNIHFIKS